MKKLAASIAALAALTAPTLASASVQTGVLEGEYFYVELSTPMFETRPIRFDFMADMTQVDWAFLSVVFLAGFAGTDYAGPGQPREYYGDNYDITDNFSHELTPTGFSFVLDTNDNATCDPYKAPYFCNFQYVMALTLDGSATSGPVAYTFKTTVLPEPSAWALMIGGFGLAGAALRRRRATATA